MTPDTTPACTVRRPRARPRFGFGLASPPDAVVKQLESRLEAASGVEGQVFRRTVLLTIPPKQRKFWSPQLDIQVEEGPEGGTQLCACFSPHPQLWTGFIGAQALFALLAVAAGVYGTSLMMLGQPAWLAFGAMGAFLVCGGLVYGGAYVGQGLGSDEMYALRAFVESALSSESVESVESVESDTGRPAQDAPPNLRVAS